MTEHEIRSETVRGNADYANEWGSPTHAQYLYRVAARMAELEAEVERLRAWVAEYGRHAEACSWWDEDDRFCDCGLSEILNALTGASQ